MFQCLFAFLWRVGIGWSVYVSVSCFFSLVGWERMVGLCFSVFMAFFVHVARARGGTAVRWLLTYEAWAAGEDLRGLPVDISVALHIEGLRPGRLLCSRSL